MKIPGQSFKDKLILNEGYQMSTRELTCPDVNYMRMYTTSFFFLNIRANVVAGNTLVFLGAANTWWCIGHIFNKQISFLFSVWSVFKRNMTRSLIYFMLTVQWMHSLNLHQTEVHGQRVHIDWPIEMPFIYRYNCQDHQRWYLRLKLIKDSALAN